MELKELMNKTIERVQLLLGSTYYIRYDYNTYEECFIVKAIRCDCDIDFNIKFYKNDMDIETHILSSFIAQRIISGYSDIFENYDKYKNEE